MKSQILTKRAIAAMTTLFLVTGSVIPAAASQSDGTVSSKAEELENMFTTLDLMDASIAELTEAMENGTLTSEELVQMYIDRINAYDDSLNLNSIISINPNALEEAKELDQERAEGNIKGKLHGIPIIVKDNYDVEGMATSAGAAALKDSIAPDDAYVVKKLKEEGAIILAKANMSEFAYSGSNSRSALGGTVHNAYDNTRTAAGSSGGTAVAITSNFAAAGLGTDTGSSIRRPSSFSNLYGLRTSLGLTSRDGVVPLNLDRDVTGPMCRNVEDLALLLEIMAGTDENDSWTIDADSLVPDEGYTAYLNADGLEGKKIGYLMDSFGYYYDMDGNPLGEDEIVELDGKIDEMVENTKNTLQEGGAELIDISDILPNSLIQELSSCGYADVFEYDLNTYLASLGENAPCKTMYDIIQTGMGIGYITDLGTTEFTSLSQMTDPRSTEEYKDMVSKMKKFREEVSEILEENGIDAVIFVSQTDVADVEETSDNKNNAAAYINKFGPVAGLPEMMIPMGTAEADPENGFDEEMPLGMSMFTGYGNEETLIEIAYAYEQLADVRVQPEALPALLDEDVLAFYNDLTASVKSLDTESYTAESYKAVSDVYASLENTDMTDMEQVYSAALTLAEAYDKLVKAEAEAETQTGEEPSIEEKENPAVKAEEPTAVKEEVVKTGDSVQPVLFITAMILSAGTAAAVIKKGKRNQ